MPDSPTLFDAPTERLDADAQPGFQFVDRLGWIPEDWSVELMERLIEKIRSGVSVNGEDRPAGSREIGVLRISAVTYGKFQPRENKAVIPDDINRVKQPVRGETVLISRANTKALVGASAFVEEDWPSLFLPDKLWEVRGARSADVSTRWLSYVLASPRARWLISASATGSSESMKNVSQADFLSVRVPTPPPVEQREIARVLGAWDRALTDVEALLDAKRMQAKGLAQRLLTGRDRLPAFANSPWHKVPLTDLTRESRRRNDGSLGQDRLYGVTKATGMVPNRDRINVADVSRYKVVRPDAFAYNPMRLNIGSIARLREASPVLASPDYVVFECLADTLDPGFLDHLRRGHDWKRFMEVAGAGSVRVRIYYAHLRLLKVHVPESVEEQRQIAAVLDAAEAEVAALRDWRDALAAQKKGLMKRLLTGEVRVMPPTVPA